ncbi:C40 family peptidase [Stappia sp.]|uniref:C40 family peptidase n=1 Tax=Stappia sp. TaxID=1870903 RepID=UPI003A9986B0
MTGTVPPSLDRRLHPVRPDLAAARYRGAVQASAFAEPVEKRIAVDSVALRPAPDAARSIDTEALSGERFDVYETRADGWAWGQLATDGYVGYLPVDALGDPGPVPTHRVCVPRSYRYPGPELKSPSLGLLSLGARVSVVGMATTRGLDYALLADGSALVARHLLPLGGIVPDWVTVAEGLLGTPYLWGGRTTLGLDCSALVQIAAAEGGLVVPRDSDMQEREAGTELDISAGLPELRRGDLLFWKGHVGILRDAETLLHANGFTMSVASEPLATAIARIASSEWGAVTACRRLARPGSA